MSLSIARCAMRRAAPALRRSFCSHTRPALGALTSKQYSATGDIQSRPFSSKDSDDDFAPKRKAVPEGADDVSKMIQQQVTDNAIMVYMKGTPAAPACGFSMQVVRILHAQGVDFSSVNILDYPAIREGVKKFSDWPTIPQVYVNREFIGGCDIVTQQHKSGELTQLFKDAGLLSVEPPSKSAADSA